MHPSTALAAAVLQLTSEIISRSGLSITGKPRQNLQGVFGHGEYPWSASSTTGSRWGNGIVHPEKVVDNGSYEKRNAVPIVERPSRDNHGRKMAQANTIIALVYGLDGGLGILADGWLCDREVRRRISGRFVGARWT